MSNLEHGKSCVFGRNALFSQTVNLYTGFATQSQNSLDTSYDCTLRCIANHEQGFIVCSEFLKLARVYVKGCKILVVSRI
jgi:hypothetical protein